MSGESSGRRMSERGDVEADEREDLLHALGPCGQCGKPFTKRACGIAHAIISSDPLRHRLLGPFLATHDEQVRAEALAPVRALAEEWMAEVQSAVTGPSTGSVDRWVAIVRDRTRRLLAALPPERLAGEVGAE